MFSLLTGGFKGNKINGELPIEFLESYIKCSPNKEKIELLHTLVYGCSSYDEIKGQLPCIKPHATFSGVGRLENLKQLSGYLYFDVDAKDIDCDADCFKQRIIEKYADKVCLLGKSVGGKGVFFYVKVANPSMLTPDNFNSIHDYFRTKVFIDLNIDKNATGIVRNQVIPYDPNVYSKDVSVIITDRMFIKNVQVEECISSCHKKKEGKNASMTFYTFLPIKDVIEKIVWKTPLPDIGDSPYVIEEHLRVNLFIPSTISDGKKHFYFKVMVNGLLLNNPGLKLTEVLSFFHYINQNRTDNKPMKVSEMIYTVQTEYDRIKDTGELRYIKPKHVITNSKMTSKERQIQGAKGFGEYRRNRSIKAIKIVVDEMNNQNIKPTINKVAEILKGRLSISTIKKYWRLVLPKVQTQLDTHTEPATAIPIQHQEPVKKVDNNLAVGVSDEEHEFDTYVFDFAETEDNGGKQSLEYYTEMYGKEIGEEMYENQFELLKQVS